MYQQIMLRFYYKTLFFSSQCLQTILKNNGETKIGAFLKNPTHKHQARLLKNHKENLFKVTYNWEQ